MSLRLHLVQLANGYHKILMMKEPVGFRLLAIAGALMLHCSASSAQVTVRQTEGLMHGFLLLSTLDGEVLADGEQTQVARGGHVTTHLVFRFKDGSLHEETTVFSQLRNFRLVSTHLVQKGPAFKQPMEVLLSAASGEVTVNYTDSDGTQKTRSDHLQLPEDVANGMVLTLVKNLPSQIAHTTVSAVAATPKPKLVKVEISPVGQDTFSTGRTHSLKATHYVIKVHIAGVAGVVAPLVGKQPEDTDVWVLEGVAPAFFRSEGPLYHGGPRWRIELVSPQWCSDKCN